jgi:hypothetical protein
MVLFIKQSKYFLLVISLLLALGSGAQTVEQVVDFANRQFEQGNYTIAAKEYNRAFFFGYEPRYVISMQIARCYANTGQHTMADGFYDRAYRFATTDSMRNEAVLEKVFSLIVQKNFSMANSELFNVAGKVSHEQELQSHFFNGISHYGLRNDSMAMDQFMNVAEISGADSLQLVALKAEFEKVFDYDRRYNPRRAYIMSGLIPGSGQMSVGAYREGINSFILLGGLYALSIWIIIDYSLMDAIISVFPWMQRYYLGGMERARDLAHLKIKEKRGESYLNILELTMPDGFIDD